MLHNVKYNRSRHLTKPRLKAQTLPVPIVGYTLLAAVNFNQMNDFEYNRHGQEQTGFDNSIDHSMFGHWRNPEYQELCQEAEMMEREKQEMNEQPKETTSTDDDDWLPF